MTSSHVGNPRFKNALAREPQAVPPIWFMRQAGRYQSRYQTLRQRHTFMEMCKNADLAANVAIDAIEDFDFDVAILFSDLLFPLEAMGMGLKYDPAPELSFRLDAQTLPKLRSPNEAIEGLKFQKAAMQKTREALPNNKSLIGFVGGPWTLFAYATEGAHKGGLELSKKQLPLFKPFCEKLVPLLERNIELQLEGGAEVVMLFDTAAGELSPLAYLEAIPRQLEILARKFPGKLGYYAKGVGPAHFRHALFREGTPLAGLGVDHRWDLSAILSGEVSKSQSAAAFGFVQGNFDQSMLFADDLVFAQQTELYFKSLKALPFEKRAGWVCGLGHGVLPGTPMERVRDFVKMARQEFAQ